MTKILLVRHGHVAGVAPTRFRGRADLPLTAEGRRQAEATARRIEASWHPVAIYASPLSRCGETGAAIGRPFGLTPIPVAGFADIDYGKWQGLSPDEVGARWPEQLDRWYRMPEEAAIPDGETLEDVRRRAAPALATIIREHGEDTVVVVAHDSVNRVLLLHGLDVPLSRYWRIRQSPCAINEIDAAGGGFVIAALNQTDHLQRR
jgi:phosphoserine phosphatase